MPKLHTFCKIKQDFGTENSAQCNLSEKKRSGILPPSPYETGQRVGSYK